MKKKKAKAKPDPTKPKPTKGKFGHGVVSPDVGIATRFKPGQSGNPGGCPKKFSTLLTNAIQEKLGDISPEDGQTYAAIIGSEMVMAAAKEVKAKGLTNQVLIFYRDVRDGTEGKPIQKVILNGTGNTDPVERVKELLAAALGRAAGTFGADGSD